MESDLGTSLRDEIGKRLGEHRPQFGEGDQMATFACPSGALGDVVVEVDGPGAIVYVAFPPHWSPAGRGTHGHFEDPDATPAEVATYVVDFLAALFDDKYVVWHSKRVDGWFLASNPGKWLRPRRVLHAATWSGPWKDPAK
jgi:hypothetical protein